MTQKTIAVEGMTCAHCKSAVEGALSGLRGVHSVDVDLDLNEVNVEYDESEVDETVMKKAIENQGYDVKH
ncbi:copper chaperone CopZ [Salinicoccus sesuvii]|uniref:Copper chaperone CopZ n=1 Tax=Salinicoccus sesuvii TaxID=868281 RepID=A0ABV7N476_9STAP